MNINKGRITPKTDQPLAVFIIGVKINKLWAVHKWFKSFMSMRPMVAELYQNKAELGFYHTDYFLTWRGITLVQYWDSHESIMSYSRGAKHLKAWKHFNKSVAADHSLGIYHEAYTVAAHQYHSVFVNMPEVGLLKAQK
ncbi:DUF4188 domain-containing protein [Alkalicoccobacillus plakortidis]|uniref:DUF4188 domain-containing protein n=1 Tax=Alkalicoccobacillus plakortidis TaxID=444060 RepID=A0ABT0XMP6_9BACI|nr:DUF4188 domain-containing protein [Alkalicoccobacillus plakortidis]MCM2677183.1 DUF4188 domain-containing protein [Alkalicoccobacillus plakortidis]